MFSRFYQAFAPDVTSFGKLKVLFTSNTRLEAAGAVCTAQCAGDQETPSTVPTTTSGTSAATSGWLRCVAVIILSS